MNKISSFIGTQLKVQLRPNYTLSEGSFFNPAFSPECITQDSSAQYAAGSPPYLLNPQIIGAEDDYFDSQQEQVSKDMFSPPTALNESHRSHLMTWSLSLDQRAVQLFPECRLPEVSTGSPRSIPPSCGLPVWPRSFGTYPKHGSRSEPRLYLCH